MLTESNYSLRQLQSDQTTSVETKSSKSDKSLSLKSSKKSADTESPSVKSSKKGKSSKKTSKTDTGISNKSDKSLSVKASKASKSMGKKSDKSAKSAKDTIELFGSKSAKQFDGLQGKSFKAETPFANAKENHHQHTVTKSFSQMSGTIESSPQGHEADGIKELDPLTKEPPKPSLISSTPVQLGLAVAILVISLLIHFVRMKRSKTKHSNATGGAYKPIATGGEAEMTEMGSEDLDAEYGMDDDDDDIDLGMPAQ